LGLVGIRGNLTPLPCRRAMTGICAFETFERPSRIDEFREKLVSFKAAVDRIKVLLEIAS
jgi:hypothetical protein